MSELIIFGRQGCIYTEAAIEKAKQEGIIYTYIKVNKIPSEEMGSPYFEIAQERGHKTFPCIFQISYVGGYEDWKQ